MQDEKLVEELTELLMENGCSVNKVAMIKLAIHIVDREIRVLKNVENIIQRRVNMDEAVKKEISDESR